MKVLILGEMVTKHISSDGVPYNTWCTLRHHLKVKDWKKFIEYIKKYEHDEKYKIL